MDYELLLKELGPVGMARFISQYKAGESDYTEEREKLLDGVTLEDIMAEIEDMENMTKN